MESVIVFATIIGFAFAGVFQIELTKIQSRRSEMMELGTWSGYAQNKKSLQVHRNEGTASVRADDYDDLEYLGIVTLGTPPQEFLIVLDTGSADLIVPDSTCGSCSKEHRYNSTKSSTFYDERRIWSVEYGDGSGALGVLAKDTCCLGSIGSQQLCIPNTDFGRSTYMRGFNSDKADGVFGLAFEAIASRNTVPPLINAINQNLLSQPIFTVWLTKNGHVEAVRGGVFTFGALDTTNCGPIIAYEPLTRAAYWQFKIVSVSSGSYSNTSSSEAISDTGTSHIIDPANVIDSLAKAVGARYDWFNDVYVIKCNATPADVVFQIGANKYTINYKNYIIQSKTRCSFAFLRSNGLSTGPAWILGDPFIRSYCNTYDYGQKRIGFSIPKNKIYSVSSCILSICVLSVVFPSTDSLERREEMGRKWPRRKK